MPEVFALRLRPVPDQRHRLDAGKIVETAKNLADDINARLPGSSLAGLAEELARARGRDPVREDGRRAGPSWPSGRSPPWRSAWPSWGSGISPGTSTRGGSSARSATLFGALTAGFNLLDHLVGALRFCATLEARI